METHQAFQFTVLSCIGAAPQDGGYRLDFESGSRLATAEEITAATTYINTQSTAETDANADRANLRALQAQAIADINAYLTIADSASNTQVRAEVKAMDIRQRAIIRALRHLV